MGLSSSTGPDSSQVNQSASQVDYRTSQTHGVFFLPREGLSLTGKKKKKGIESLRETESNIWTLKPKSIWPGFPEQLKQEYDSRPWNEAGKQQRALGPKDSYRLCDPRSSLPPPTPCHQESGTITQPEMNWGWICCLKLTLRYFKYVFKKKKERKNWE